ncbi:MAG: hypothetical protein IT172_05655 [Acidobacteria bacterium]|nr:hypothetical protein [Acidobacteriota bacterium]
MSTRNRSGRPRKALRHIVTAAAAAAAIAAFAVFTIAQDTAGAAAPKTVSRAEKIRRWFVLDALSVATRIKAVRTHSGTDITDTAQWQFIAKGHFNFDRKGRYRINAALATGNSFTASWNNSGIGPAPAQTNLYLKQLYLSARPIDSVEFQVGGIIANNGENSEITAYDNDGFMTGERIILRSPKHLFFDEISLTNGFLGDPTRPDVFYRFRRMNKANYRQVLARKLLGKRLSFSGDYTFEAGRHTLREAVKYRFPKGKILDSVLFENYQRVSPHKAFGFALWGEKSLAKRFSLSGGFARIDRELRLNTDRFPPGKRVFVIASYKPIRELAFTAALIQGVGGLASPATPRTRLDLVLTYNILETLKRLRLQ